MNKESISISNHSNMKKSTHEQQIDIPNQIGLGLLMILLLISLLWRISYLSEEAFNYDEGHWWMFGKLAVEGFKPYTEIFVGIPPMALLTIQAGVSLFGSTWNVRIPMMLYSLVGVISMYWLVSDLPF